MRLAVPLCLSLLALTACTGAPDAPPALTEAQQKDLDAVLAGKVPGEKISCISATNQSNLRPVSNTILVNPVNRKLAYRNDVIGRCSGLTSGGSMVIEMRGSQYCRGDRVNVVDFQSGMWWGACALGDFVPYRAAK